MGKLTKIEHHFLDYRCGEVRNLDLVIRDIWLALKSPKSTAANRVLFSEVNVIHGSRRGQVWGQVWESDAHELRGLVPSGHRRATAMMRVTFWRGDRGQIRLRKWGNVITGGGKRNEIYRVWSQTQREVKLKKKKKDLKKKGMGPISKHCGNVNEYENAWAH